MEEKLTMEKSLTPSEDGERPGVLLTPLRERTTDQLWLRALSRNPDGTFLIVEDEEFTYRQAEELVAATTRMLRTRGVTRGDHVAILLDNRPEYVWLLLAVGRIGAVGVPIHAEAKGQLLAHFFGSSDCTFAVIAASRVDEVDQVPGDARRGVVWIVDDTAPQDPQVLARVGRLQVPFQPIEPENADTEPHPVAAFKDTYLLMFTSGTSGPSKAAVVSQAQPITHALKIAEECGWRPTERLYTCLPLSHANAQCHTMFPAIGLGATMILGRRFSVSRFWSDVQRAEGTAISLLGSMLQLLSKKEPSPEESENAVSTVLVVPFPRNVQEFDDRYQAKFATLYGLTECAPVSFARPGEGYGKPLGMAGTVLRDHNDVE